MAKTDDLPAIDEATIEMLEGHVKKGKARKFFLIYKGASIKTLVVFKKGPFGPKVMKAKKSGFKGDVSYGIVTGSGKNLFFQLPANGEVAAAMKVDSWEEKPPVKRAKFREFLLGCDLKFKPVFHMLASLDEVPDPDSESDIPVPPPPGVAIDDDDEATGSDEIPDAPPPPDPAAMSFVQRLKKLKPDLDQVVAAKVEVSQHAKLRASEAGVFARKKEFDTAIEILDDLELLIKKGLAQISGVDTTNWDTLTAEFNKRLSGLLPQIKRAADSPDADDIKLQTSEARGFARKMEFEDAHKLLDRVESLLEDDESHDDGGPPPPPKATKAQKNKLAQALKKVIPAYKNAVGSESISEKQKSAIADLMKELKAHVGEGDIEQAKAAFGKIVPLVKKAAAPPAPPPPPPTSTPKDSEAEPEISEEQRRQNARSPVALRATIVGGWSAARKGIRRFGNAILADDELGEIDEIANNLKALDSLIPDEAPLVKLIKAYESSDDDNRESTAKACRDEAISILKRIDADERLEVLESNQIIAAGVVPPLRDTLNTVITALR